MEPDGTGITDLESAEDVFLYFFYFSCILQWVSTLNQPLSPKTRAQRRGREQSSSEGEEIRGVIKISGVFRVIINQM